MHYTQWPILNDKAHLHYVAEESSLVFWYTYITLKEKWVFNYFTSYNNNVFNIPTVQTNFPIMKKKKTDNDDIGDLFIALLV